MGGIINPAWGRILGGDINTTLFEAGVLLYYPEIGYYFVSTDGDIQGFKFDVASTELFELKKKVSVQAIARAIAGDTVIHGGAVLWNEKVIAFIGKSGVGKSTISYEFIKAGGQLIAESGLIFPNEEFTFLKTEAYIKLFKTPDSNLTNGVKIHSMVEKHIYLLDNQPANSSFRPDFTFVVGWDDNCGILEVESKFEKFAILHHNSFARHVSNYYHNSKQVNALWFYSSNPLFCFKRPRTITSNESYNMIKKFIEGQ